MEEETLKAPETEAVEEQPEGNGSAPSEQETGSADGQAEAGQATQAPEALPKGYKWNGDVNELPDAFRERGRGMQRHFTEVTETLAQQRKQLEAERVQLQQQLQMLQQQAQPKQQAPAQPEVDTTEQYLNREYQIALENGDTQKLMQVQNQLIDHRVQRQLQSVEPQYRKMIEDSQRISQEVSNKILLKEFGEKNPEFWTHRDSRLAQYVVRDICDRQGKPLSEAQKVMDDIAKYYQEQARRSLNQTVQEQKRAMTAAPSVPVETKYVYVKSQREADRMNIEFASDGSDKIAMVKK